MEFSFTEEQEFFRQTVRDTIDRMIMPKVQQLDEGEEFDLDRKSTRLNSSHVEISYAVFCLISSVPNRPTK